MEEDFLVDIGFYVKRPYGKQFNCSIFSIKQTKCLLEDKNPFFQNLPDSLE